MKQGLETVKRFLCVLMCLVALTGSLALATPQVITETPASLLGDASRQKVFVLTGDAEEVYHRLLIAPEPGGSEEILLDTSTALPLIKSQYSSDLVDGFSVRVLNGRPGALKVIDPQGEEVQVKQRLVEAGDYIALVTNEEDNGVYNFNLLFVFNKSSKQFELKSVLQVSNSDSCDRSFLSVVELPEGTVSPAYLASFDGREALRQLRVAHVAMPLSSQRKLMTVDAADLLDMALAAYRKGDKRAFKDVMGYALMGGGTNDVCDPKSYIVKKYYYPQSPGWSNDLGFLLGEAGYYPESIELLNAVIVNNPNRTVAYLNIADSYWAMNNKARAIEAYRQYASRMSVAGKASKIPARVVERSVDVGGDPEGTAR
jgi:tetratricopeptide (TPR) repeat protein